MTLEMNDFQKRQMLKQASDRVQRIAGQIDSIDMNLIEYYEDGRAVLESARLDNLRKQYEEACADVEYWAAIVHGEH